MPIHQVVVVLVVVVAVAVVMIFGDGAQRTREALPQ